MDFPEIPVVIQQITRLANCTATGAKDALTEGSSSFKCVLGPLIANSELFESHVSMTPNLIQRMSGIVRLYSFIRLLGVAIESIVRAGAEPIWN